MAAQDYVFVASGEIESAHPLNITVNAGAGCAGGVSGQVNGLGVAKMPQLVIEGHAGTAGSM